jgi:hypothetical protein
MVTRSVSRAFFGQLQCRHHVAGFRGGLARHFGFYPKAVLAEQIYRTRENLRYCKEKGIRLSGGRTGCPSTDQQEQKRIATVDASARNAIEGKF